MDVKEPQQRRYRRAFLFITLCILVCLLGFRDTDDLPIKILKKNPLIDGHNDLLILLRYAYPDIYDKKFDAFEDGGLLGHVDIPRIEAGHYSGAFWSAFVPCPANVSDFSDAAYAPYVKATLEQIDLFNRLAMRYPKLFTLARNAQDAAAAFPRRLISPLAIEGLHQIGNSLATLRLYHELGVRYSTLTWNCHNKYADAAVLTEKNKTVTATPLWHGLSDDGKKLILEMNRLGMIVDLSHVSANTMRDVLSGKSETVHEDVVTGEQVVLGGEHKWHGSIAPPIFSHSSVYAICPHPRNVPDDVLDLVKARRSLVMINFSPDFISCEEDGDLPRFVNETNTIDQVVKHITYVGERIGWDYVGIGTDFDGIENVPRGMEDVSKFPDLVQKLLDYGLSQHDIGKILGRNLLRVWAEVDAVSKRLQKTMHPVLD